MKRLGLLALFVIILVASGGITGQLTNGVDLRVVTTDNPEGSVFTATPDQALAIFLFIGFIVINLVVVAGVLALIFWWLNRQVRIVETLDADQAVS